MLQSSEDAVNFETTSISEVYQIENKLKSKVAVAMLFLYCFTFGIFEINEDDEYYSKGSNKRFYEQTLYYVLFGAPIAMAVFISTKNTKYSVSSLN